MAGNSMERPYWLTFEKRSGDEWIYLRKNVRVDCIPDFSEVCFSSSGISALYINGEFVECATGRYPYRINRHEITGRIRKGVNTVAILLGDSYFYKIAEEEYRQRGIRFYRFALVFHCRCGRKDVYSVTDGTWKYALDKTEGWEKNRFNDSRWTNARALQKVTQKEFQDFWSTPALWKETPRLETVEAVRAEKIAGKDYGKQVSGSLSRTVMPELVIENARAGKPDRDRDVPDYIFSLRMKEGDVVFDKQTYRDSSIVLDSGKPSCILDFGRLVVGYLELEFDGEVTGTLRCEFDYVESIADFLENAPVGREIIEKLSIETALAKSRRWFSFRRRAFRFLKVEMRGLSSPVKIKKISLKTSVLPVLNKGWFSCSDTLLNRIWETSRYTLLVNMHQEYESCPRNEMLFFTGDGRVDGLMDYYCFGDGSLMKASMNLQHPPDAFGLIQDIHQETGLWDYPAWRVICIADYYRYSDDRDFVKRHYRALRGIVDWYMENIDENFLIYQRPIFTQLGINEWTCGRNRLGYKIFLNSLFFKTSEEMAFLAGVLGNRRDEKYYGSLCQKIKKSINSILWNERKSTYVDSLYGYIPQDGNVLAIIFGIAGKERAERILDVLENRHWSSYGSAMFDIDMPRDGNLAGKRVISPVMCAYEAQARFENGQPSEALTLVRRCWGTMLKKGAKTFWEFTWNDPDSRWPIPAHAWSGGPAFLLPAYVLGVRPLTPGFRSMEISPQLGGLEWAKGVVPTPLGLVPVSIKKKDGMIECIFSVPKGIEEVKVVVPRCRELQVNGKKKRISELKDGCLYLNKAGTCTISCLQ